MKLYKLFLVATSFMLTNVAYSQSTTYSIDYSYETLNANCNVFQTALQVDGFNHESTIGFPTFTGATTYYVNLQCKRNSSSSQVGTEYQIIFPFKKYYKYQINIQAKGTVSNSNEYYPMVGLKLNEVEKTHNTSGSCTAGPQAIAISDYDATASVGSSLAWNLQPIIDMSSALTKNYESLSIGAIPWPGSATGTQSVQVRAIQIVETQVYFPVPPVAVIDTKPATISKSAGEVSFTAHLGSYDPDGQLSDCTPSWTTYNTVSNPIPFGMFFQTGSNWITKLKYPVPNTMTVGKTITVRLKIRDADGLESPTVSHTMTIVP